MIGMAPEFTDSVFFEDNHTEMKNSVSFKTESGYLGRYSSNGELVMAGKFIGGALGLYGRDGEFHYNPRYEKMYYEGEFDDISNEEFEEFKKELDALSEQTSKYTQTVRIE